jgi:hypothetical protein
MYGNVRRYLKRVLSMIRSLNLSQEQPSFDSSYTTKQILINQMIRSIGELPLHWQSKWGAMSEES